MEWEAAALGVMQGIFEWLPVSSKSVLMLLSSLLFSYTPHQSYALAIALQGGTVASATIYFHRYLRGIYRHRCVLRFLVVATLVTGAAGIPIYLLVNRYMIQQMDLGGSALLVGILLLMQALVRGVVSRYGSRSMESATLSDALVFGLIQALSILPGVSRSGATVLALLYLGYSIEDSLKLSFLASIPANIGATLVALLISGEEISVLTMESFAMALVTSSAVGAAAIGLLIRASSRHGTATQLLMAFIAILIGVTYIHFTR